MSIPFVRFCAFGHEFDPLAQFGLPFLLVSDEELFARVWSCRQRTRAGGDVAFPRILLAVPLVVAGMYAPAAGSDPAPLAQGALGMSHEHFVKEKVTVGCGGTLPLTNNSRWVHIIGPGKDGILTAAPRGVPVTQRVLLQTDQSYTTGRWTVPGDYHLTCSVHPEMTVEVVVTGCCCEQTSA